MATFDVTMRSGVVEQVEAADAYQQEGPMTTFFRTAGQRGTVDSWSTRVASFRTAEVNIIRRSDASTWPVDLGASAASSGVTVFPRRTA